MKKSNFLNPTFAYALIMAITLACAHKEIAKDPTQKEKITLEMPEMRIPDTQNAQLGVGDVYELKVFLEPDLSGEYRVSSDGSNNFPLVGTLSVTGKTPNELAYELQEKLKGTFLKNPQVSVFVKEFNSKRIYIFGEVTKPGAFPYESGMGVVQAIALAGGFTKTASKNKIHITRVENGVETVLPIKVDQIVQGAEKDISLRPGDIIFVPEGIFL